MPGTTGFHFPEITRNQHSTLELAWIERLLQKPNEFWNTVVREAEQDLAHNMKELWRRNLIHPSYNLEELAKQLILGIVFDPEDAVSLQEQAAAMKHGPAAIEVDGDAFAKDPGAFQEILNGYEVVADFGDVKDPLAHIEDLKNNVPWISFHLGIKLFEDWSSDLPPADDGFVPGTLSERDRQQLTSVYDRVHAVWKPLKGSKTALEVAITIGEKWCESPYHLSALAIVIAAAGADRIRIRMEHEASIPLEEAMFIAAWSLGQYNGLSGDASHCGLHVDAHFQEILIQVGLTWLIIGQSLLSGEFRWSSRSEAVLEKLELEHSLYKREADATCRL